MDSRKAVHIYHRNLAMVVGLILLMFLLIPAMVKSPYILNIFVKEINEEFKAEYGVDMNGHSAESYTVVWLFKAAIEAAGSTDGAAANSKIMIWREKPITGTTLLRPWPLPRSRTASGRRCGPLISPTPRSLIRLRCSKGKADTQPLAFRF